jgi:hypothetical protein
MCIRPDGALGALSWPECAPLSPDFRGSATPNAKIRRLLVAYGPMTTGELAARIYARPTQRWHWGNVSRHSAGPLPDR